MRKCLRALLLCAALCAGSAGGAGAGRAEAAREAPWLGYRVAVRLFQDSPGNIVIIPPMDGARLILVRFVCVDGEIPMMDIAQSYTLFSLRDADGDEYPAVVFFPQTMLYNPEREMFSTAPQQTAFDLYFVVGNSIAPETMTLLVQPDMAGEGTRAEIALGEIEWE